MQQKVQVPFRKVTGKELKRDFFEFGPDPKERTINDVYIQKSALATNGYFSITGVDTDDGIIRGYKGKNKVFALYGIFETKRNIDPTSSNLKKILLQELHYRYKRIGSLPIKFREFDVFILASSRFFGYVLFSDIKDMISKLDEVYKDTIYSPSKNYSDLRLRQIIEEYYYSIDFHISYIDDKFQLNKEIKDIYLHCLNH